MLLNTFVVFVAPSLENKFPKIEPTVWGYKLSGNWDLSCYQVWYQQK